MQLWFFYLIPTQTCIPYGFQIMTPLTSTQHQSLNGLSHLHLNTLNLLFGTPLSIWQMYTDKSAGNLVQPRESGNGKSAGIYYILLFQLWDNMPLCWWISFATLYNAHRQWSQGSPDNIDTPITQGNMDINHLLVAPSSTCKLQANCWHISQVDRLPLKNHFK